MISILPRENYEQFVALQRAVKLACGDVDLPDEDDAGGGSGAGDGVGVGASDSYLRAYVKEKEKEQVGQTHSLPSILCARSAEVGARTGNGFSYDAGTSSGDDKDKGSNYSNTFHNRRRLASASDSTIASRGKLRPEPKFQKMATSKIISQMKRDSFRISRDPERFLGGLMGDKSSTPLPLASECLSNLLNDIDKDSSSKAYESSLASLQQKCRQAKNRTLLLNLKGNTGIGPNRGAADADISAKSGLRSSELGVGVGTRFSPLFSNGPGPGGEEAQNTSFEEDVSQLLDYSREDNADLILQSFLDEIKHANVDNITSWIDSAAHVNDLELPFGLPTSGVLKLPTGNLLGLTQNCIDFVKLGVEEFLLLDAEYHAKLEELRGRIVDNFRELELAKWQSKDAALLFHLMNLTQQGGSHFAAEKLCTEVATRIFPSYSREDIVAQKYRLKVKKALEEKRDSIIKHWLRDKESLVKRVNSAWDDIQKKEKLQEDLQLEKRRQQERCRYWTDLLEKLRKENRKKVRTIQTLVQPLEEQLRRKQKQKDKLHDKRRQEQKEMIDKFQRLRMESVEDQKRRQEEIQMLLEKDRKIRQIHNRARVHLRRKEFEMKRVQQKEFEKRREEDRQKRLDLLEKTKEKVDISYHPFNVLSDTHASLVRSHEIQTLNSLRSEGPSEEAVRFFRERYGFSAETLWRDTRVRVEAKLREAGLIENSYARHVLQAMQPKAKPHLMSQIKFDD